MKHVWYGWLVEDASCGEVGRGGEGDILQPCTKADELLSLSRGIVAFVLMLQRDAK